MNSSKKILVLGAGAAGLFFAKEAASKGHAVTVFEYNDRPGKKILVSGGGRCNFTNLKISAEDYYSNNPHFCKSALSRYSAQDFIAWVEKQSIEYYEKKLGQLFCRQSAKLILNALVNECCQQKVTIKTSMKDYQVEFANGFQVKTLSATESFDACVVATGGVSFPGLGVTDYGLQLAKKFGHRIHPIFPALVPVKHAEVAALAGISCPVRVTCGKRQIEDDLLFTHKGLSGPAILKISLFWKLGDELKIEFLAEKSLPKRLKNFMSERDIYPWRIKPTGTEGFKKAEVMGGGIDTKDVSSKTFESLKQPGLYFIGEVLDVTGLLGGHNFQWAWSSAFCCAHEMS